MLVAQDLAWYGRDVGEPGSLAPLLRRLDPLAADGLTRVRLLYLYPSEVRDPLVATMLELPTVVPYFDLSLQHADAALLRRMKRWGSGDRFLAAIDGDPRAGARRRVPVVVHRRLPGRDRTRARRAARVPRGRVARLGRLLPVLAEDGTPAATLDDAVDPELALEWLRECEAVQEPITRAARDALVGREVEVLVDALDDDGASDRPHAPRGARDRRRRAPRTPTGPRPGATRAARTSPRRSVPTSSPRRRDDERRRDAPAGPRRYGDDAIATPANIVTIARLVLAVPTLLLIVDQGSTWLTFGLWFVLTTTDGLDGWLARRDGTTRSGAFLDPLADKFLVLGGFFALGHQRRLLVGRGDASSTVREVGVSMYRSFAARRGISLPARKLGKWKAFFQFLAVGVRAPAAHVRVGDVPRHPAVVRGRRCRWSRASTS